MNNFSKLIKAKVISFNEVLIESYKQIGLDEFDTMILMHLNNQLLNNDNLLSITNLGKKVTLSENDLSNRVLLLVQKGFLELLIDDELLFPLLHAVNDNINNNNKLVFFIIKILSILYF